METAARGEADAGEASAFGVASRRGRQGQGQDLGGAPGVESRLVGAGGVVPTNERPKELGQVADEALVLRCKVLTETNM